MVIKAITKEKLDKIRDLIDELNKCKKKNYGPGKFFTNETIVNGDKLNVLIVLVNNLMVDAEELQKTIDSNFFEEKKHNAIPKVSKTPKVTKQISKPNTTNDIDMLLI